MSVEPEFVAAGPAEADRVRAVLDACARHDLGREATIEEARDRIAHGEAFLVRLEGEDVAFAGLWQAGASEARAFGRVAPVARGRGVGTAVLERLVGLAKPIAPLLTVTSWAGDDAAAPLLESLGFVPIRYFLRMDVELDGPRAVDWPDGIALRAYRKDEDDAPLFAAWTDAFSEHFGPAADNLDDWLAERRSELDPELWFLAVDERDEIAGFTFSSLAGKVGELGVVKAWRGRGLGRALLAHSLETFRERGLERASLNVDAENTTSALRLYRSAGMVETPSFTIWGRSL